MANNQMLTPSQTILDFHAQYGYPAGALVVELEATGGKKIHMIWYANNADPSANFPNAPVQSVFFDTTSHLAYILTDAGVWGAI